MADWILILVIITAALTPVFGMRTSRRQNHIAKLRRRARALGLQISLNRRPDALENESSLEFICYRINWKTDRSRKNWVLHCFSNRGKSSPIQGWNWFDGIPDSDVIEVLESVITQAPNSIIAIVSDEVGVGIMWGEKETIDVVDSLHEMLQLMRNTLEKK